MDHVWKALEGWAEKLGLVADDATSKRLDVADLNIKASDTNVSEFTRRRNHQDVLGAAKVAAA
ncbi:hypothetical protein [Arthrobacter burdickii]|uniref:Uncharacterized protein n=1 Tax=Arthrobacter burdickii TaxID=3035920 RepID=A0ABT8K3A4_9MICC|nr:hypothetical protein [Arthrobacter burdickii]MDN4611919.1 hypothetical protein [Arthrobacter burdickii]